MRRKRMYNCRMPMRLQFFAEGDGAGGGSGSPGDTGGAGGAAGGSSGSSSGSAGDAGGQQSFDDFLGTGDNRAEFERRVQAAVSAAQEKWQVMTDDKLSEAEKLAKMSKDEKAEYLRQKKEKELADREAAVTRKELMAEAKNTLAEKKLPAGLAEVLDYTDAESCKKSITTVEKVFQQAVQSAVEERLKGGKPPKRPPEDDGTELEKQVEALMMGRF